MATSSFLPPKRSGRGISCLIGCLIIFLLFILITAVLSVVIYYFLFLREKEPGSYFEVDFSTAKTVDCEGSLVCLDSNFKKCVPAKGTTDMGDFAEVELEILGVSQGDPCVVYAKVLEVKELPPGLDAIPDFIVEKMFENLSMECLVPKNVYQQGIEKAGEYIGDNIYEICRGPLLDFMDKFGIEVK